MTEFLEVEGGRIAYDVTGDGPLVVLLPGMGIRRDFYRSLTPQLVAAGYRVAAADLRGLGESSTGWESYTRTDTAADTLALIRHLGGPAVIVRHSFSGGSATIAAAQAPEMVTAIMEIGPFTRVPKLSLGALLTNRRYRKGTLLLLRTGLTGSVSAWTRYLDHAFPGLKPPGYGELISALQAHLREPGRMAATRKMGMSRPTDAEARLGQHPVPRSGDHGHSRPGLARSAGRGGRDRRRDAGRARPRGDDRGCRALPAHPVPGSGRGRHAAVPEGSRECLGRV